MGRASAEGFAEAVRDGTTTLDSALSWHLSGNHYPPIPQMMIPACKLAIEAGNEGEYDRLIQLPEGVVHRVHGDKVPAREIIEHAHLDSFIEQDEDECGESYGPDEDDIDDEHPDRHMV